MENSNLIGSSDDIESEVAYLEGLNAAIASVSEQMKNTWIKETVAQRYIRINDLVFEKFDGIVQAGPFKGMKIPKASTWTYNHTAQMILGLYEKSVHDVLFRSEFLDRRTFIDVGAADGYYLIGLCLSGRMDQAYGFEIVANSRDAISRNAKINNQRQKIAIKGIADYDSMTSLLDCIEMSNVILLVDIEGGEFDFLCEELLSLLKECVIVIEVHNWIDNFEDKYRQFLKHAKRLFKIEALRQTSIDFERLNLLPEFPDDNRFLLMSEGRPCLMRYLVLSPKEK
jgi:hypothetical protein